MKRLIAIFLLTGALQTQAQPSPRETKGDKYFNNYAYADAVNMYARTEELSSEGLRRLAKAFSNIGKTKEAEEAYQKFINASTNPEDFINYAMVLKTNGKYEAADMWMQRFVTAKPSDLRAKDYVANGAKVKDWMKDNGKYNVKHLSINTDQDDFSPAFLGNKIVFASSRNDNALVDRTYNWNDKPFLDIYVADNNNGQLGRVKNLDRTVNMKWHEGPASFSNGGTIMAYTRNNYTARSKDGDAKFDIYFRELKDKKWSNEKPFKLNNVDYSVGHPWLSEDGNTMYFASDMPGGKGGSDIYRIAKNSNGDWGNPENLGDAINTEGNEMFPFYDSKNGVMFFASNGLTGLGGLDIFMAPGSNSSFGNAMNMGANVNSVGDDFGLILDANNKGFFSSNRNGGAGGDDLYSIEVTQPFKFNKKITGLVTNKSGNAIPNASITITDANSKSTTLQTDANGSFAYDVERNQNYTVKATADKHNEASLTVNTNQPDEIIKLEFTLNEAVVIKVGTDLAKVVPNMRPIYFDLGKSLIRSDAAEELDKIVKVMNENPAMTVELGAHTDCRGNASANKKLSDARAKSSADYIRKRITNPTRISGKGYGESKLLNDCDCEGNVKSKCTEDEHQMNRRTEFIVTKM